MKLIGCLFLAFYLAAAPAGASACSVFMWSDGRESIFANNEDSPVGDESVFTFVPASAAAYGYFYMKFPSLTEPFMADYPQGGMNEKGLAYDITATPLLKQVEVNIPEATPYSGGNIMELVLKKAATVDEAVALIKKYKASENIRKAAGVSEFRQMQVLLADRYGNAAVVGVAPDGGLAVTGKTGKYRVVTNFSLAQPGNSAVSEKTRFDTATEALKGMKKASVGAMRSLLAAVHVEGMASTLYSTIYDLRSLDINIYNFHDYEYVKKIDLKAELSKGEHSIPLAELFRDRPLFSLRSMTEMAASVRSLQEKYLQGQKELATRPKDGK